MTESLLTTNNSKGVSTSTYVSEVSIQDDHSLNDYKSKYEKYYLTNSDLTK